MSLVLSFYVPYFSVLCRYLMFSGIFSVKSYILVIYWYFVGISYVTFAYEPNSWDVILLIEATVYYAFGLTFVEALVVVLHAFFSLQILCCPWMLVWVWSYILQNGLHIFFSFLHSSVQARKTNGPWGKVPCCSNKAFKYCIGPNLNRLTLI